MTDAEHAKAIRRAVKLLADAVNAAVAGGLIVTAGNEWSSDAGNEWSSDERGGGEYSGPDIYIRREL